MSSAPTETWAEVARLVPGELRPYLLDVEWDRHRLWALELPVERLSVAELDWHLDLPYWPLDGRVFALAPREVLREPHRYGSQYARTLNADLRFPLHVTRRAGRWTIIDGVHRLAKAALLGLPDLEVKKVHSSAFPLIAAAAFVAA